MTKPALPRPAHCTTIRWMKCILLPVLLLLLLAAGPVAGADLSDPLEDVPPVTLDEAESAVVSQWGIGFARGIQSYAMEEDEALGESGTVNAVQLTYRALLETGREGRWLFELGYEYAESDRIPEVADATFVRVRSNGVFYRFSRFIGSRFYLGGRVGLSRVRGPEDKRNLDLVVGLQTGVRVADWLDVGVEAVAAEPNSDGGRPLDVRGVVTVGF